MAALKAYGTLEWQLSGILQVLLNIDAQKAKLVFYRIVNTRARYAIIDDLISIDHAEARPLWARLENLLQGTDTARNHLTHWVDSGGTAEKGKALINPVSALRDLPDAKSYYQDDVEAFALECDTLSEVAKGLRNYLNPLVDNAEKIPPALLEIIQRPPENPKREEFRQALFDAIRPAPPPPSEA